MNGERRRSREIQEAIIRTIPGGTRCYLWDIGSESMSKEHLVLQADMNVLVRPGYGPMYGALKEMAYGTNGDARDVVRQIPGMKSIISHGSAMDQTIGLMAEQYSDADAILMAVSTDGRIGLLFLDEGISPDLQDLR